MNEEKRSDLSGRIAIATAVYQTNQDLIQFVESKTNFLLVVHGLVLSVLAARMDSLRSLVLLDRSGGVPALLHLALLVFAVTLPASLLTALSVILARGAVDARGANRSLIFFRHVASRRSCGDYADQFIAAGDEEALRDLLQQNHALARLAASKFDRFRLAFALELAMLLSFFVVVAMLFARG